MIRCLSVFFLFGVLSTQLLRAELVAHWPLDEAAGQEANAKTGDYSGTIEGAEWIVDALAIVPSGTKSALTFDPEEQGALTTTFEGILEKGPRTLSAWVRADPDQPANAAIISWGGDANGNDRITLQVNTVASDGTIGALRFDSGIAFVTGTTAIADGDWHHVAAVIPEGRATTQITKLFVDGVLEAEVSGLSELDELVDTDSGAPLVIGASGHAAGYGFLGAIDDVRIYNHALSEAEIAPLATSGIISFMASPPAAEVGEQSALRWEVETPFNSLTLDPGGIDASALTIGGVGSMQITITEKLDYVLTLARGDRTDQATVAVRVAQPVDVRINEIMSSNERTIDDEDGDDSDWIELKNFGDGSANMDGWFLTDSTENLNHWSFPEVTIAPGETLLVFASGKDRSIAGRELHTDFRLSSAGEYLALVAPNGQSIISEFAAAFPVLPTDISYGLSDDGTSQRYFAEPTPGNANGAGTAELGPVLRDLTENPDRPNRSPEAGEPVTDTLAISVTALASQAAVNDVKLYYRVMFGEEAELPMQQQEGNFNAEIPLDQLTPGEMLRWRVEATDSRGVKSKLPAFEQPTDSPEYYGTAALNPGHAASSLPVVEWFVESATRANRVTGTRCSLLYLGQFYDNVFVRLRGASSAGLAKKSYKFEFNKGRKFRFRDGVGRVDEFNLNTTFTDKTYLRQSLAFEIYDKAGVAGCESFPMRVEQNGTFFSVAAFVEQPDPDLLEREGLDPNGALYKMYNNFASTNGADKKSRKWEVNSSDLNDFIRAMRASDEELTAAIFDFINVPATLNYLVATVLTQNNDSMSKNYYLYRDSDGSGQWFPMPWDLDLTFGRHYMTQDSILSDIIWADEDRVNGGSGRNVPISPSHPMVGIRELPGNRSWNRLIDKLFENEIFTDLYRRRLRTVMDEILMEASVAPEQRWIDSRIDEMAKALQVDAALDLSEWRPFGRSQTLAEAIEILKSEYLDVRRIHLYETHAASNGDSYDEPDAFSALLPPAQIATPMATFGNVDVTPVSGDQLEEFIEIQNSEATALDISGWMLEGAVSFTFAPGSVIVANGKAYVSPSIKSFINRTIEPRGGQGHLVLGPYDGQLSARGETLKLFDSNEREVASILVEGTPSAAQQFLRISELHYAPLEGRDAEFIELTNRGAVTIDLSGVTFENGISFTFPAGAKLEDGQVLVLAANLAGFQLIYPGVPVFGEFEGSLNNAGERLTLRDSVGENILDFRYDDTWYPEGNADGKSLEILDVNGDPAAWRDADSWRISNKPGGSPSIIPDAGAAMSYAIWAQQFFSVEELENGAVSAIQSDANGDGVSNGLAYALDLDPKSHASAGMAVKIDAGLKIVYERWVNATDLTYALEGSNNLIDWELLPIESTTARLGNHREVTTTQIPQGTSTQYVRLRLQFSP